MRVAVDALAFRRPYTGVQRALSGLLRGLSALAEEGDASILPDDSFVLLTGRGAKLPELSERFEILRTFFRPENRTLRIIYQHCRLHGRLFKAGAEVLHAPAYTAPRFGYLPLVLTVHDTFVYDFPSLCKKTNVAHFRSFVPASVRNAGRIIVPSEYTRERLCAQFTEAAAKTVVIPFGVDESFFAEKVQPWPEDERPLPERFVLYLGALEPKKNLDTLIKAFFAITLSKKLDLELVIAGPDTGRGKHLRGLAEGLGFGQRVHFPGFVEEELLPALYRRAEALVLPSVAEGFGFPMLEAMASGTPVVASGIPALRELGGKAVRYYVPGNVAKLREALEDVLGSTESARSLARQGRKRARLYSWKRTARATMNVYREARDER